jgi:hypothetical protein
MRPTPFRERIVPDPLPALPPVEDLQKRDEAHAVAAMLADSYQRRIVSIASGFGVSKKQAADDALAIRFVAPDPNRAPDELTLADMEALALEGDGGRVLERWEEVKAMARRQLAEGYLGGKSVEMKAMAIERAQFMALVDQYNADLQPRNEIERTLIRQMAMAYLMQIRWQERMLGHVDWADYERKKDEADSPYQKTADAIEQAASMAERFNRQYCRLVRIWQGMRRSPIVVQNLGGQVNVGEQQINMQAAP